MNRHVNRRTTTILCAAGGLVAAAMLLGARSGSATDAVGRGGKPRPKGTGCDVGNEAMGPRATADFGLGAFTGALSGGKVLARGDGEMYVAFDLAVANRPAEKRQPVNMAIVIDRSGSMAGDKLAQARQAARGIVDRLAPTDRVSLVQYDDAAQVVVAATLMDAEGKARMLAAIDGIQDGGNTNIYDGLALGRDEVSRVMTEGKVNRVLLLSDGKATAGRQDPTDMARLASQAADQGIRVTTIGLGLDYNEDLMEALAESGRGQYYYVKDGSGLQAVFEGELRAMQATVATGAELRLTPSCAGVEIAEVYGYETRRDGTSVIVPLSDLYGGDHRKLIARLRVPVGGEGAERVLAASLGYTDAVAGGHKTAALALAVEVSADSAAVIAAADKDVMAKVEHVEAARTIRRASAAYERGDRDGAVRMLEEQKQRTQGRADRYDLAPEAVAPAMGSMGAMQHDVRSYAPGDDGGKDATKKAKANARAAEKH